MKTWDTGHWDIWIDDLDGDLAMEKTDMARRKIEVIEKEIFDDLKDEFKRFVGKIVESSEDLSFEAMALRDKLRE